MDFFKPESASITMSHIVYTNDHMRDASHRGIFNNFFLGRTISTPTILETTPFGRYNLNPDTLIAALGWGPVITEQPTKVYPDTVYQFYANLKLEGPLSSGKFSTYVDGHIMIVTPLFLAQVLRLPLYGDSISSLDQFYLADFNPSASLSHWTGESCSDQAFSTASKLPDNLKKFHFFLTRILLPRSHGQFLVTPMDTWITHSVVVARHLNFCSLMFATMVHFGNPDVKDDLPFRGFISALVERLANIGSSQYTKSTTFVLNMCFAGLGGPDVSLCLPMAQGRKIQYLWNGCRCC
ncbi:hypothetical protein LINPERPRIM_LOCUS22535 [Linum perenne]